MNKTPWEVHKALGCCRDDQTMSDCCNCAYFTDSDDSKSCREQMLDDARDLIFRAYAKTEGGAIIWETKRKSTGATPVGTP